MIESFIQSWALFQNAYLAGLLMAALLGFTGVFLVARDQIFLGAAVAQASTLGVAIALWAAEVFAWADFIRSDWFIGFLAVTTSATAALATARGHIARESHEAITGWVFLISAAATPLVVAHSPHGLEEVHKLVASSIIGAQRSDVWILAGVLVVTVIGVVLFGDSLKLLLLDEDMARAVGMQTTRDSALAYLWIGVSVGLSIRISGLLYSFGMLVLPALVAKNLSRHFQPIFWMAPVLAVATALTSFVLANHFDLPPAQLAVLGLAILLIPAWLWRRTTG